MIAGFLFSAILGLAAAKVLDINISLDNDMELLDGSKLTPRLFNLTIQNGDNNDEYELLNMDELTPKRYVENRATTSCGCGYSVSNPNPAAGRIVGGQEVSPMHSRPYQVYVQTCFSSGCGLCGGTLLNKRYVLTAMHCVQSGSSVGTVTVALGEHNVKQDIETHKAQAIKVERIIRRSDYNENTINNDIAILRLAQDVVFNDNVVPACLPTNPSNTYTNYDATVSGWGTTSESGSTSNVLKETTVKIVPQTDSTCTYYNSGNPLPNTKMCGYKSGTDSCQGDSGGPLVVKEDGRFTVVGVVSYGHGCARPNVAGVYARVTTYLDWINANIQDGFCSDDNIVFPTNEPTTAAPTTTASPAGAQCDMTCTNVNSVPAGNYYLNGILSSCSQGFCSALDGTDLCEFFGYPCGGQEQEEVLSCSNPCQLDGALFRMMSQYDAGQLPRLVSVRIGFQGIRAECDLETGECCPLDYPDSDLCSRLGWFANIFG